MARLIGAGQAVATTAALTTTFNSSGTFAPATSTFDALVIAGGGGGGVENVSVGVGGGGGAGGFREVEEVEQEIQVVLVAELLYIINGHLHITMQEHLQMVIHLPPHHHKEILVVIECLLDQMFQAVAVEQEVQESLEELVDLQILEYQE